MFDAVMNSVHHYITGNMWVIKIFFIVLLTLTIHAVQVRLFRRIIFKAQSTKNFVDETLIDALHKPLGFFIWLIGISFAANVAGDLSNSAAVFSLIPTIRKLGVLIIITWFCLRFIRKFKDNYIASAIEKHKTVDQTLAHAISQLLIISTVITSILAGMQIFGLPISGLLAFGGVGGAGVVFASKDLLANFFGGLIIYLDRPFKIGDWIRSPDKSIEGVVEHIGWRVTCIRTFDKRPLYVPNGFFLTISVENPSRMTNRRIKATIGVRYQDAAVIDLVIRDVEAMLQHHPDIDQKQTLIVNLIEFGPSSLNFMVYTFTKTTDWVKFQAIQQNVLLKILKIIESHHAECAFPTQTLHIADANIINHKVMKQHEYS